MGEDNKKGNKGNMEDNKEASKEASKVDSKEDSKEGNKGRCCMAAWDYKTVKGITEKEMDELGLEGWELVKIDSLGGTAIFKRRHHYPPIPRNWTGRGSWGGSWGRKHPDD